MKIIIMGPQGSGKSTQAKMLSSQTGLTLLDVGELLRSIATSSSELGRKIRPVIESGNLVDDTLVLRLLEKELSGPLYQNGFIIDGVPRTQFQAENLSFRPDRIFYLKVGDEENIKRLLARGRADDTPEAIRRRLAIYHKRTLPILAYYRKLGILEEVDGERGQEEVALDVKKRLDK